MAENNFSIDSLRDELNSLRSQMESMLKSFQDKKGEMTSETVSKIAKELEHYRNLASARAHDVYEQGQAGLEEVGEHVRKNPLASLAIAFGAGYVVSCLFRHLK
ncbi:MAG: hypothetical protein OSJ28_09375 [Desulfovibrio sp.]|nr:hypothetical protein [Desulfovibrio sp.]